MHPRRNGPPTMRKQIDLVQLRAYERHEARMRPVVHVETLTSIRERLAKESSKARAQAIEANEASAPIMDGMKRVI